MAEKTILPKFYTDKHIPKPVTTQLRKRGVDIVRCEEVGLDEATDITHLEYATREGRVVITNDADFVQLHHQWQREGKQHAGIMYCLPNIQGTAGIGRVVNEVMLYHELIEGGAGTVATDLDNRIMFVS
jgi:predicted nuclease of predicted toxin-antitoxin system